MQAQKRRHRRAAKRRSDFEARRSHETEKEEKEEEPQCAVNEPRAGGESILAWADAVLTEMNHLERWQRRKKQVLRKGGSRRPSGEDGGQASAADESFKQATGFAAEPDNFMARLAHAEHLDSQALSRRFASRAPEAHGRGLPLLAL